MNTNEEKERLRNSQTKRERERFGVKDGGDFEDAPLSSIFYDVFLFHSSYSTFFAVCLFNLSLCVYVCVTVKTLSNFRSSN